METMKAGSSWQDGGDEGWNVTSRWWQLQHRRHDEMVTTSIAGLSLIHCSRDLSAVEYDVETLDNCLPASVVRAAMYAAYCAGVIFVHVANATSFGHPTMSWRMKAIVPVQTVRWWVREILTKVLEAVAISESLSKSSLVSCDNCGWLRQLILNFFSFSPCLPTLNLSSSLLPIPWF